MYDVEMQKKVIKARAEGKSIRAIAEELGLSPTTVCDWNKEFAQDIAEDHKHELESVLEDHHAAKLQRVRALARAFNKIERYLQTSDNVLKDYKLYALLMRLDKYITQDILQEFPPKDPDHECPDEIIQVISPIPRPYNPMIPTAEELANGPQDFDDDFENNSADDDVLRGTARTDEETKRPLLTKEGTTGVVSKAADTERLQRPLQNQDGLFSRTDEVGSGAMGVAAGAIGSGAPEAPASAENQVDDNDDTAPVQDPTPTGPPPVWTDDFIHRRILAKANRKRRGLCDLEGY